MNAHPFTALGIDVGGTKIAAGVVEFPAGRVAAHKTISTGAERGPEAVLRDVVDLAGEICHQARVQAVGVGLCELVDPSGRILSAHSLRWEQEQVSAALSSFGPVVLEADVRAAARAEGLFGAGQAFRAFLYVTVGTGISSCLMLSGSPYLGALGATGTMASRPLKIPCERCGGTSDITLEGIASGPALVARYNRRKPGAATTGAAVLAAAANRDPDALWVVRSAAQALGSVVALLINVLDPEAVIVGGGLGLTHGPYWETFEASTREHVWSDLHRSLPIVHAMTGHDAGVIGAGVAAWQRMAGKQG
jgi:glucokinase